MQACGVKLLQWTAVVALQLPVMGALVIEVAVGHDTLVHLAREGRAALGAGVAVKVARSATEEVEVVA